MASGVGGGEALACKATAGSPTGPPCKRDCRENPHRGDGTGVRREEGGGRKKRHPPCRVGSSRHAVNLTRGGGRAILKVARSKGTPPPHNRPPRDPFFARFPTPRKGRGAYLSGCMGRLHLGGEGREREVAAGALPGSEKEPPLPRPEPPTPPPRSEPPPLLQRARPGLHPRGLRLHRLAKRSGRVGGWVEEGDAASLPSVDATLATEPNQPACLSFLKALFLRVRVCVCVWVWGGGERCSQLGGERGGLLAQEQPPPPQKRIRMLCWWVTPACPESLPVKKR